MIGRETARGRSGLRTAVPYRPAERPTATRSSLRAFLATGLISLFVATAALLAPAPSMAKEGAATATPGVAVVSAADCRAAPRPLADFDAIAAATPLSFPEVLRRAESRNRIGTPPAGGVPADPATVAGVTAAVEQLYACLLTVDLRRYASLLTDENFRRNFAGLDPRVVSATPTPNSTRLPLALSQIEEVQVLPDGRVAVEIRAERGRSLSIFVEANGRYLLDVGFELADGGTPTP